MKTKILIMVNTILISYCCFVIDTFADVPSDIKITKVRWQKFTVSWISQNEEIGMVRYGKEKNNILNWTTAYDNRGKTTKDDIHYITLNHLEENTTYFFNIVSGNITDNNKGNHYSQKTGQALGYQRGSCQVAGKVFIDKNQTLPAYDSIVYVTIQNENSISATESCLMTDADSGYWHIELINATTVDYSNHYTFICGESLIHVQAQSGANGFSQLITPAVDYTIRDIPALVLDNDPLKNAIFILQFLAGMHENFEIDYTEVDENSDGIINFRDFFDIFNEI